METGAGERITLEEGRRLARAALERAGCDARNAAAVAEIMIVAERDGCASHGLFRLKGYVAALHSGRVNGHARPTLTRKTPAALVVDGDLGFAPLAFAAGREALAAAARAQGVAGLALKRTHHFAALWPEVEALAAEGLIAFATTAASPMVAPAGAKRPLFGTNPIAFACPRASGPPVAFDMATAAMARGEIQLLARAGASAPEGVGIDAEGRPSTDPAAILAGAQLPFGGVKGSLVAMMVELLAGVLIGEPTSVEAPAFGGGDGGPPYGGELILAFDPPRLGAADGWRISAERFFARLEAEEGVRLPGARRLAHRARTPLEGFTLDPAMAAEVRALAGEGL